MLTNDMQAWGDKVAKAVQSRAVAVAGLQQRQAGLAMAMGQAADTDAARGIVQVLAANVQNEALGSIATTCTHALAAVFGADAYTLQAQAVAARGRTEVGISFAMPSGETVDPVLAAGGGAVDIAAFALRVAAVLMHQPAARKVLVLDEPFKFLSEDYRPAAAQLLEQLAEDLGFQFIIVTHIPELAVGKVVQVQRA